MKTKKEIIEWLKSANVYDKFMKNLNNLNSELTFDILYTLCHKYVYMNIISSAFPFSQAPEGFKFWDEISNKFQDWIIE